MSNSLRHHELQHSRLPCPLPSPRVCSNSCPLSWWCYLTVSSTAAPIPLLPSVFPSLRIFSSGSAFSLFQWVGSSHQVAKVLELQLQPQSFQWIFRVDFFSIDWFDLLAVQGTLKSLLQHHNLKASNLWCLAFFRVQLSHLYMTTGKTIALTIWTFVSKMMSLLSDVFNTLSRFVIAFLPRSRCLLISWLQSPSAVILQPKKMLSYFISYTNDVLKC